MNFSWTEEQRARYESVVAFAESELAGATEEDCIFPYTRWMRCAEFGVLGWAIAKERGGAGYTVTDCAHLMEALGYGCKDNGLLFALGTQMWGLQRALLQFGSESQIQRYIEPMLSGKSLGSFAINEPGSGSDALALGTTAVLEGDEYILHGEKTLISMAPVANFALVFAVTDASAGRWGISVFVVDAITPGYTAHKKESMMGLHSAPIGRINLDQCRVPVDALLGKQGAGASIFAFTQGWERSLLLSPQIGTMQRVLEESIAFSNTRMRGQQSIGKNQSVAHGVADMMIQLETCRLLLYKTAWMFEQGEQNLLEAAITKTYLSEAFVEFSLEAIKRHGGDGYASDTGVEQNLRDAIGGTIYGGTCDVQRNIIAGLLGL